MNRRVLLWIILFSGMALASFFSYAIYERLKSKKEVKERLHELPSISLLNIDSGEFNIVDVSLQKPLIVIFFNSECEHCQNQAQEILRRIDRFSGKTIVMISTEYLKAIKIFSDKHDLGNRENIIFSKVKASDRENIFGILSIPHIFIYDVDHKLVKEYRGETKIESILNQFIDERG